MQGGSWDEVGFDSFGHNPANSRQRGDLILSSDPVFRWNFTQRRAIIIVPLPLCSRVLSGPRSCRQSGSVALTHLKPHSSPGHVTAVSNTSRNVMTRLFIFHPLNRACALRTGTGVMIVNCCIQDNDNPVWVSLRKRQRSEDPEEVERLNTPSQWYRKRPSPCTVSSHRVFLMWDSASSQLTSGKL